MSGPSISVPAVLGVEVFCAVIGLV